MEFSSSHEAADCILKVYLSKKSRRIPECGLVFCLLGKCLYTLTEGNWKEIVINYLWNFKIYLLHCVMCWQQSESNLELVVRGRKAGTGNIRNS